MEDLLGLTKNQIPYLKEKIKRSVPMIVMLKNDEDYLQTQKSIKKHLFPYKTFVEKLDKVELKSDYLVIHIQSKDDLDIYVKAVLENKKVVGFLKSEKYINVIEFFEHNGYSLDEIVKSKLIQGIVDTLYLSKNKDNTKTTWQKFKNEHPDSELVFQIDERLNRIDLRDWQQIIKTGSLNKTTPPLFCVDIMRFDCSEEMLKYGVERLIEINHCHSDGNYLSRELLGKTVKEQAIYYFLKGLINFEELKRKVNN